MLRLESDWVLIVLPTLTFSKNLRKSMNIIYFWLNHVHWKMRSRRKTLYDSTISPTKARHISVRIRTFPSKCRISLHSISLQASESMDEQIYFAEDQLVVSLHSDLFGIHRESFSHNFRSISEISQTVLEYFWIVSHPFWTLFWSLSQAPLCSLDVTLRTYSWWGTANEISTLLSKQTLRWELTLTSIK